MATKLNVGLVGCGGISGVHFPGWKKLNPDCRVAAICDILPAAMQSRGTEFEIPKDQWYSDHRDMLRRAHIDAVDICVPNYAHAEIAVNALKAGKHVICEKPLAPTPALVRRMIAARNSSGKLLMTAQHQRFLRNSQNLKAYIDSGALGEIYYARAQALRRRLIPAWGGGINFIDKTKSGGGPCIDIGVHILDLTMFLMGHPEPVTVSGVADCRLGKRTDIRGFWGDWDRKRMTVEDFAVGFVRFKNGATLTLECSWLLNIKENELMRVQLCGTEAGAVWPELMVYGERAGCTTDTQLAFPDDKAVPYHLEIEAFSQAILKKKPSPVPPEQSLNVMRILDGLYRSHAAGKEVKV